MMTSPGPPEATAPDDPSVHDGAMVLMSLLWTALMLPVAGAVCFGVQAVARKLGHGPAAERVTAADRRWLADQHVDLHR